MRVLGLDISSVATGWAVVADGKIVAKGVINIDDKLSPSAKTWYLHRQVETMIVLYDPDELAVEDVFLKINYATTKVLSRLAGTIQELWYRLSRKDVIFYYAVTARSQADLGVKPASPKEQIMEEVNKKFKFRPPITDNNVSDAVLVAYCGWKKRGEFEQETAKGTFGDEKSSGIGIVKKKRK